MTRRFALLFGTPLLCLAGAIAFVLSAPADAQELVTLTTPTTKTINAQHVSYIGLDIDNSRILVELTANTGEKAQKVYDATTTPSGATLLHSLNIGNFSVNSLMKAVYNRLITDGIITGTISGTPQ